MIRLRLLFGLLLAVIVLGALYQEPRVYGDGGEYLLMTQSLFEHGSPELRPEDLAELERLLQQQPAPIPLRTVLRNYNADPQGRRYCYHFWGYSVAALPVKLGLHALHVNEFKALQITNALLLSLVLWLTAFPRRGPSPEVQWRRITFAALVGLGPPLWFVLWPHPEVFSCCLVMLALVSMQEQRWPLGVLCAALGSLQNPPLVFLAGLIAARGALAARREWRQQVLLLLALLPTALPFLFYWSHFGVPSLLVARHEASSEYLSIGKALELLFDLNLGLLPYVPLTLLLFLVAAVRSLRRPSLVTALFGLTLLMAWACTSTNNWNHGTSGPSRYGVWLLPIVCFVASGLAGGPPGRRMRTAIGLALLAQVAILVVRGGMLPQRDHHSHSTLARFVLDRWPRLYNPTPEIFVERTLHTDQATDQPVVYRTEAGVCRKAYAQASQHAALLAQCGPLPEPLPEQGWGYINY